MLSSLPFLAPHSSGAECAAARLVKSMATIVTWFNQFHQKIISLQIESDKSDKYQRYKLLDTVHVNNLTGDLVSAYEKSRTWSHT